MADTSDPQMLDKRVVSRYLKKGLLAEKDYERHLKSLPDLSANAAPIESTLEPIQVGTGERTQPEGGQASSDEE